MKTTAAALVILLTFSCFLPFASSYTAQDLITFALWRLNLVNLQDPCLTWSNSRLNSSVNILFGFMATNAYTAGEPLASSGCYNVSYACYGTTVLSSILPVANTWDKVNTYNSSIWGGIIPMSVLADPLIPGSGCQLDLTYYPPTPVQSYLCSSACASQYNASAEPLYPRSARDAPPPQTHVHKRTHTRTVTQQDKSPRTNPPNTYPIAPPRAAQAPIWAQNTLHAAGDCSDEFNGNFFAGNREEIAACFNGHTWKDDIGMYL